MRRARAVPLLSNRPVAAEAEADADLRSQFSPTLPPD